MLQYVQNKKSRKEKQSSSSVIKEDDVQIELSQTLSETSLGDPEIKPSLESQKSIDSFSWNSQTESQTTTDSQTSTCSQDFILFESPNIEKQEMVSLPFERVIISKPYCFICKEELNIREVPFEARIQAFVKRRIFIPRRNMLSYPFN